MRKIWSCVLMAGKYIFYFYVYLKPISTQVLQVSQIKLKHERRGLPVWAARGPQGGYSWPGRQPASQPSRPAASCSTSPFSVLPTATGTQQHGHVTRVRLLAPLWRLDITGPAVGVNLGCGGGGGGSGRIFIIIFTVFHLLLVLHCQYGASFI
jgi:hypothetical protein